jgi:hypothetical protein
MTECIQSQFEFAAHFSSQVVAQFDGGTMITDGGGLLLRETDRRLNLLPRLAACFVDRRSPLLTKHSVHELVAREFGHELLCNRLTLRHEWENPAKTGLFCKC